MDREEIKKRIAEKFGDKVQVAERSSKRVFAYAENDVWVDLASFVFNDLGARFDTGCAIDDVNGDGFPDLAVSNGNDIVQAPNLVYFTPNGFMSDSALWISANALYSGHCDLGDYDSDGFPELAVSNYISPGWEPELKETVARDLHSDTLVVFDRHGNVAAFVHSINTVTWGSTGIFVEGISIPDSASFQQEKIARVGRGVRVGLRVGGGGVGVGVTSSPVVGSIMGVGVSDGVAATAASGASSPPRKRHPERP